jgi:hypothetical protein
LFFQVAAPARFAGGRLAFAALLAAAVASASCRRRALETEPPDGGGEGGGPSLSDGGRVDAADAVGADLRVDAPIDLIADAPDAPSAADGARDAVRDTTGPAICPAGAAPLDVCGCGCCGVAAGRDCYYPTLGESRDTVPNPMPTPQECATTGCDEGDRYLCCFDPGVQPTPPQLAICATNTSGEDLPRFSFTTRDAIGCTTIEIGSSAGKLSQVATPFGPGVANGWRGPCDGTTANRALAIGGLGSVATRPLRAGDSLTHYDVHVALFFDNRTGVADVYRVDVDDIAPAPFCTSGSCPLCAGACAFAATYRYGFVGGHLAFTDTVILAPPASYQHVRSPVTAMSADVSCAPPAPPCDVGAIDVGELMLAFADPDVQQALARALGAGTIPFYGRDERPSDGSAFQLTRDGGGGLLIGAPCPPDSTPASCTEIPGGLSRLRALLVAFDQQQLQTDPACAPLRP